MPNVVFFDLDDTLFDHRRASRSALTWLQSEFPDLQSVPLDDLELQHLAILNRRHKDVLAGRETIDSARRKRFTELLGHHKVSVDPDKIPEIALAYRHVYENSWCAVDGVVPLLRALKSKAKVGIISNNVVDEQLRKLKICGLDELLDVIVISEEAGVAKPDPKIYAIALERAGATSSEAVMVGDAWEGDILGAQAVGIRPVWYNHYRQPIIDPQIASLDSFIPVEKAMNIILGE